MMTVTTAVTLTLGMTTSIMTLTSALSKKKYRSPGKDHHSNVDSTQKDLHDCPSHYDSLTAVIFLIFDVEIALLLPPMTVVMLSSSMKSWMTVSFIFLLILIIGLYHDWNQGALEWAN